MFVVLMMPHVGPMIRQYNVFYSILFYAFIIKTHSIEQFNKNEITLQDCGIIIIYSVYIYIFIIIIIPALKFISHARVLLDNFYYIFMLKDHITVCIVD
jgi:hypothetical protein